MAPNQETLLFLFHFVINILARSKRHLLLMWLLENNVFISFLLLAKLPSVSTLIAQNEGCHRFISGSGLDLVISTVSLEAFSTFEKISLGAFNSSQSTVVNSILDKLFSLFPDLIASHFLGGHTSQLCRCNDPKQKIPPQHRILLVFQIKYTRSNLIFILHLIIFV